MKDDIYIFTYQSIICCVTPFRCLNYSVLCFILIFSFSLSLSQRYVLLVEGTHQVVKRMAGVMAFKE